MRSVVRSDSLPDPGLLTGGLGSAESDCTATSPEGSSGSSLPVGCNAVFSSRLRGGSLRRSRGSRAEHLGGMQRLETLRVQDRRHWNFR